ncbi:nucleic-acid-binding protein from transposon X-element [Trichonephila clavata]|uniref:Nucleic-acid-binding protein from transposon X-element n=1 Tax=Trichonephila clavata TaxID=2740835 RepID=A0A8X6HB91_TRICU|nr:nucleic-acid-binding protein from transposon X-element [Trichonephila clavata]
MKTPIFDDRMESTSDEDACQHVSYLGAHATSKENKLRYLKAEIAIAIGMPSLPEDEMEKLRQEITVAENELQTILGELALVTCPIVNCPAHSFNLDQNAKTKTKTINKIKPNESSAKIANNTPAKNNDKSTVSSTTEKNKIKRNRQEEFKLPKNVARVTKDLPPVQPCTTKKLRGVRVSVQDTEEENDPPAPTTPKIKPIMMRINKNYNLILQEIYRKYQNTINKSTGDYIRIQPKSQEDNENIVKLLIIKKGQYYTKDITTPIKVVIKGLPIDTDVADIEADLKEQGIKIEKIAQLRKFSNKAPLPFFMIELKPEEHTKIANVNSLCYISVWFDPFRRKPGATQCYNCNFFNHTSKNCRMTPRCIKCGDNHRTSDCPQKERSENPHCINCNEDGHIASP